MQTFLVGGAVRDEIMGQKSKDLDYTVVIDEGDLPHESLTAIEIDPFEFMCEWFENLGYKIFVKTPEHFTIRAQTPDRKETADFVLARREGPYSDGRRPDFVTVGTLMDDLSRRDFCFNAIAKDADGNLIDPHNGVQDINDRVIRAVSNAWDRLNEDALRAVRALRFSVTTGFRIDHELKFAMQSAAVLDKIRNNISDERIQQELAKMFKHDTLSALAALHAYPALTGAMFDGKVSLEPTMKQRARRAGRKIDMSARSTGVKYHYPDNNGG